MFKLVRTILLDITALVFVRLAARSEHAFGVRLVRLRSCSRAGVTKCPLDPVVLFGYCRLQLLGLRVWGFRGSGIWVFQTPKLSDFGVCRFRV